MQTGRGNPAAPDLATQTRKATSMIQINDLLPYGMTESDFDDDDYSLGDDDYYPEAFGNGFDDDDDDESDFDESDY